MNNCFAVVSFSGRILKFVAKEEEEAIEFAKEEGGCVIPVPYSFDAAIEDDCYLAEWFICQRYMVNKERYSELY